MSSSIHTRPSDPQSRVGVGGSATSTSGSGAGAANAQPLPPSSASATILDTLKKKMSLLKDELENAKDDIDRTHRQLDDEKRRRECVNYYFIFFLKNKKKLIYEINILPFVLRSFPFSSKLNERDFKDLNLFNFISIVSLFTKILFFLFQNRLNKKYPLYKDVYN